MFMRDHVTNKMATSSDASPVRPSSAPSYSASHPDGDAIFYEISPTKILFTRMFNVVVCLMVVISFILCLVQAVGHTPYYLLACNIVISAFVGIVINWWYRGGALGSEKYWYIILVGFIIVFQCVTTDIFIFHVSPTTMIPLSTATPLNFSTTHHTV
ncbi:uncharacterized protein LOC121380179 [Gigantopelta aegis]|uniref:uncharacterized protein LOC121380179 n=1 Tax=Gigantopelta aegis TaxID=1735272 RepID=UPI001B88789E|nr:uncharacterized protein LOC121380179 [Gigantopelta aegis]